MSKFKELVFIFFLSMNSIILTSKQTEKVSESSEIKNQNESIETDQVDDLFENNEQELPAPKFEKPSNFIIFFRYYGIALLHKYYDIKNWISNKLNINNK